MERLHGRFPRKSLLDIKIKSIFLGGIGLQYKCGSPLVVAGALVVLGNGGKNIYRR
jgi:hypothetical protein